MFQPNCSHQSKGCFYVKVYTHVTRCTTMFVYTKPGKHLE